MNRKTWAAVFILTLFAFAALELRSVDNAVCRGGSLIVTVSSPENKTYSTNFVPISVSASDPTLNIGPESIAYSLDGGPPVIFARVNVGAHSLAESTVLTLYDGSYSLVAIATTWFGGADGVFSSSPVNFTVDTSHSTHSPTESPSATSYSSYLPLVAALVAILAVVALAILLWRTKVKQV